MKAAREGRSVQLLVGLNADAIMLDIEDGVAWAGETTSEILIESLRAIDGVNVHDLLGRLTVPTLALHGTQDKIVPYSHAQKMVAAIPGARLVVVPDAGHAPNLVRPDLVDRALAELLDEVDAR